MTTMRAEGRRTVQDGSQDGSATLLATVLATVLHAHRTVQDGQDGTGSEQPSWSGGVSYKDTPQDGAGRSATWTLCRAFVATWRVDREWLMKASYSSPLNRRDATGNLATTPYVGPFPQRAPWRYRGPFSTSAGYVPERVFKGSRCERFPRRCVRGPAHERLTCNDAPCPLDLCSSEGMIEECASLREVRAAKGRSLRKERTA